MKNSLLKIGTQLNFAKMKAVSKVKSFLKDETSAKSFVEEGYLMYASIVLGIILLAVVIGFLTNGFTSIGTFFNDGVNGNNTKPNGWGK